MTEELVPREVAQNAAAMQTLTIVEEVEQALEFLQVESQETYEIVAGELREVVTKKKNIEEARSKITRPIMASHKAVMDFFDKPLQRLAIAEGTLKHRLNWWYQQEQVRIADEKRQQQEGQELQRKTLLEQAEKVESEAIAVADPSAAEELANQAERLRDEAQQVGTMPAVVQAAPKATGVGMRALWKFESVDKDVLIEAAAKDTNLRYLLSVDEKALRAIAKAAKGKVDIPGVVFKEYSTVAVRRTNTGGDDVS